MKNLNMFGGGVNSPEVLILKARLVELAAEYKAIKAQAFKSKEYQALIALCEHCLGIRNTATYIVTHQQITNIIPALEKCQVDKDSYTSLKYFYSLHQVALKNISSIAKKDERISEIEITLKKQLHQYANLLKLAGNKTVKAIFKATNECSRLEKSKNAEDNRRGTALRNFEAALAETLKNCSDIPTFDVVITHDDFKKKVEDDKLDKNSQAVFTLKKGKPTIVVLDIPNNRYENAVRAHEVQHFIQFERGQLAFIANKPFPWVYDVHDEIEAYQTQYNILPAFFESLGWENINKYSDINVATISEMYDHLPKEKLSLASTLADVEAATIQGMEKPYTHLQELKRLYANPKATNDLIKALRGDWASISKLTVREYLSLKYRDEKDDTIAQNGFGVSSPITFK